MIVVVVLAAGLSTRIGRPKQTLELGGEPTLERVLRIYRGVGVDRVVVVLGAHIEAVRERLRFEEEDVVVNPRYKEGMSGSLKVGLAEVEKKADAMIVALGDQPFVRSETIARMIDAHARTAAPVVVPTFKGKRGNPVLFDKAAFARIRRISGDVGAKSVVASYGDKVLELAVDDPGVLFDIDTRSDYEVAASLLAPTRSRRSLGRSGRSRGSRNPGERRLRERRSSRRRQPGP